YAIIPHSVFLHCTFHLPYFHSFPTRRSSDLVHARAQFPMHLHGFTDDRIGEIVFDHGVAELPNYPANSGQTAESTLGAFISELRSEEHTSELQSRVDLVCRLLLEKKKIQTRY